MSPKNETSESNCTGPVSATSVNIGDDGEQLGNCFFCGQLTTLCCNFCQNIFYCSKVRLKHKLKIDNFHFDPYKQSIQQPH